MVLVGLKSPRCKDLYIEEGVALIEASKFIMTFVNLPSPMVDWRVKVSGSLHFYDMVG